MINLFEAKAGILLVNNLLDKAASSRLEYLFIFTVPGVKKGDNGNTPKRKSYDHSKNEKALCRGRPEERSDGGRPFT